MVELAPVLIRQLEPILTTGYVRNWCVTSLSVEGNLGAASPGVERLRACNRLCLLRSCSHLEECGSQVFWDAFACHWLTQVSKL